MTHILSWLAGSRALAATPVEIPCEDSPSGRHCVALRYEWSVAPQGALVVDNDNGGITATSGGGAAIVIRATVEAVAKSKERAIAIAREVEISQSGTIRAEGPKLASQESFQVGYEITAPHDSTLDLRSRNGGLSASGFSGTLALTTINGGIAVGSVRGSVRGSTVNGGLSVALEGDAFEGEILELTTTNGGISLSLPERYAADLDIRTVNGGYRGPLPASGGRISVAHGGGGAPIHLSTTNGGISIVERP